MKINFASPITGLDDQPLTTDGQPLTLRAVSVNALLMDLATPQGPEQIDAEQKVKNALLAHDIYKNDDVDLKAEDVASLKARIGKAYGPLVVMRAWELLDPPSDA